ncbi:hypothetical protein [Methanobrevibacter sp.]|uniref:hypothetical protein n=1 Tax=Methanobrevibacter sp. TaxID=66852 RepID=UPI00388FF2EC
MNRLIGGLILLNLTAISLNLSAGEVDITDEDVKKQLTDLRVFIDENRDFTKESKKGLKPVLVQYRSSGSKFDGIVQCNLSFNTDALHLSIGGKTLLSNGKTIDILINVVYEWTEYVGYTIDSATLLARESIESNIPSPVVADSGKVLGVNSSGEYVLKDDAKGTQLYEHAITISGIDENEQELDVTFYIYSKKSDAYTLDDLGNGIYNGQNGIVQISAETNNGVWAYNPYYLYIDSGETIYVYLTDQITNDAYLTNQSINDTITPL